MATQVTATLSQLAKLQKGFIQISMTHWTDTAEPELAAGSGFEVGGVPFYCDGNDDLDVAGAWGGIANSSWVYIYYAVSGSTATAELSTTAPTWDAAKQDWMDAGATKRCIGSIFKDGSGNYSEKTIFLSREHAITYGGMSLAIGANGDRLIRLDSAYALAWDTSESGFVDLRSYKANAGAADVQLKQLITAGAGAGAAFNIKKPIMYNLLSTVVLGVGFYGRLQIQTAGGWYTVASTSSGISSNWAFAANPGTYRLYNDNNGTTTLYAVGVYGDVTITAANIVT